MSTKKLAAGLLLATSLALSACSADEPTAPSESESTPSAGVTLNLVVSSSPSGAALTELAKDFESDTGVHINVVELTSGETAMKVLLASQQSQASYDIVQFDSPDFAALASGQALLDLTDYLESSTAYNYDDFSDQVKEYAKFDGTSFAIPLSTEPYILWSNSDLLQANGLEPADTLIDYVANAQALSAAGAYGSNSGFSPTGGAYYWLEAVYMFGGRLNVPGQCISALDSPEAKAATDFYFDMLPLTPASTVNGGGNAMTTAFIQGDVGQMVNATGYYSIVADPDQSKIPQSFEMTLPPASEDGRHTLMFGWLIGITSNTAAPDEAWQFLEFALGQDAMSKLIELGGPPPARTSLAQSPDAKTAIPYVDLLVEASSFGEHLPYTSVMSEVIGGVSAALSEAAANGSGPDVFLAQAHEAASSILADADVCQ